MRRLVVGIVAVAGAVVLLGGVFVLVEVAAPLEAVREMETRSAPGPFPPAAAAGASAAPDERQDRGEEPAAETAGVGGAPLRVVITLAEGSFDIAPAEPGEAYRVDAEYNAARYALEEEFSYDPETGGRLVVGFRRKVWALRGLLSGDTYRVGNRVRVFLPRGVPLELDMNLTKGEHEVRLGGLAVSDLELVAAQGQILVFFGEPNPVPLERMSVSASMGQTEIRGLGHASPASLDVAGSMGDVALFFDGETRSETRAEVRMSMGSLLVRVPRERPVAYEHRQAFLGTVETLRRAAEPEPGGPPALRLDLHTRFGSITVN